MFEPAPFHPLRPTLVAPVRVDASGRTGPTRAQARSAAWRRTSQGLYVPATVSDDPPQQRIVEAAALLPSYGGVTGWAALNWLGGRWFDGLARDGRSRRDVCLATAGHVRAQPGVAICEEKCRPEDLVEVDGLRITTAVRSVCFEMRYAPTDRWAVVALDMAAYSDLVSIPEAAVYAAAHNAWTGIPRCRWAIPYSSENAWSIQEVLMRLVWELDAGHPRPLCNVPVFDRHGRHLGTPDLLDPVAGVVGEYAGSLHLLGSQRARDLQRESDFRSVGLEYVTMVAADHADPEAFIRRLAATYRRAAHAPESTRAWTIVPPSWWTPTRTVAQRRALDATQRGRLLRYRRAA